MSDDLVLQISRLIGQIQTFDDMKQIFDIAKRRWGDIQRSNVYNFRVGERVEWDCKYGRIERGVIEKINQKTIIVKTDGGIKWTVGSSLLRAESGK